MRLNGRSFRGTKVPGISTGEPLLRLPQYGRDQDVSSPPTRACPTSLKLLRQLIGEEIVASTPVRTN
jgi:hypothetical protein